MQKLERHVLWIAAGALLLQAFILYLFGQPLYCECGYIKVWEGVVLGPGNSQHLTDWYTFSHFIHGFLFYAILWFFFPKTSFRLRFLVAVGAELLWEVWENTSLVIEHYRLQALANGYEGDTILNSLSDSLAGMTGFIFARRFPVWSVVAIALVLELFVAYMVRDNLTLNIVNFIHSFPAIDAWQRGV